MAHQHGVAELLEAIAGIDYHAVFGRLDRRAFRHGDVDAVGILAGAESGDDAAANRPAHLAYAGGIGRLHAVFGRLVDDLVGLLRRRIGSKRLARRRLGWRRCGSRLDRIDLGRPDLRRRGAGDGRRIAGRDLQRLADADQAVIHTVGLLQRCYAHAGLPGDGRQRIARFDLVGPRRDRLRSRLGIVRSGGIRRQHQLLLLQLGLLRQHRHLFERRAARQRNLVIGNVVLGAPRGARIGDVAVMIGRGNRRFRSVDVSRDDDFLARLKPVGGGKAVRPHDDVGRHAVTARQIVDGLPFADRDLRAAGA